MPPGGPPPPAGNWNDPVLFTSASGHRTDSYFTHPTLEDIDRRLTVRTRRWETLKRLRVLRLKLTPGLALSRVELDTKFPRLYYDVYADPRLSTVLALATVGTVKSNPAHIDLDWFGAPNVNWWGGGVDGAAFHLRVAEEFQYLLENSFGLANSKDRNKGSADPQFWTWHGNRGASWQDDLIFQRPPPGTTRGPVLTIEWNVDIANGPETPTVQTTGSTVRIESRMPGDQNGIQLP